MRLTGIFLLIFLIYLYNVISVESISKSDQQQQSSISKDNEFPQQQRSKCCLKRVITEPLEVAGTYNFKKDVNMEKDSNCVDGCYYSKENEPGNEYCFKAVFSDAATFNDECDVLPTENPGPTSSSPEESTTENPGPTSMSPGESTTEISETTTSSPEIPETHHMSLGQLKEQECLGTPTGQKIVPPGGAGKTFLAAYEIIPPKGKKQYPSGKIHNAIPVNKENVKVPVGNVNTFQRGDIIEPPTKSNCSKEKSTESKPINERKIQPPQGSLVIPPSGFIISPPIGM